MFNRRCARGALVGLALALGPFARAQEPVATPLRVESNVSAVTLYRGRAAVTRTAAVTLQQGLYEVQFAPLPETIQPETIQARAGAGLRVIAVDFVQAPAVESASPRIADLDRQIEQAQFALKEVAEQRELIKSQEEFLAVLTARSAAESSKETGTPKLDLEAVKQQLAFIAEQRQALLKQRRDLDARQRELEKQLKQLTEERASIAGRTGVTRTAVVTVAAPEAASANIELTYLAINATWEPAYNVRAALDGSSVLVEYDAILIQRTGEDWDKVRLTLSTAQPTVAANPPTLQPWFVDIRRPEPPAPAAAAPGDARRAARKALDQPAGGWGGGAEFDAEKDRLRELASDAQVSGGGPSVTFELPRQVTVKTNIQKQQRTRVATIDSAAKFVHVAAPLLTPAVYVRGELVNASAYQILPGRASIFVGQEYVGPTGFDTVAPGGEFRVHFGIDQAVRATRQLVAKKTDNTGLLGGGRRTSYEYRLTIDNGAGKPITVELWDRYPISRSSDIQVDLVDLSTPLAADPKYTTEEKPQGLMKWLLNVPSTATGKNALAVTYGLRINRAKDVEMTPLPE